MKSIQEIFGENVHHHVWTNIGNKDKSSVCRIEDLIPLMEEEKKLIEAKIELLKQFEGTNVCVPLESFRGEYTCPMRTLDDWFEQVTRESINWCTDAVLKGYELVPCSPVSKALDDYKEHYVLSKKQKNKIEQIVKDVKNFFAKNIAN